MKDITLKFAKLFSLDKENFNEELSQCPEPFRSLVEDLLIVNLTDPNFSSLAESIPLSIAGYKSHDLKHGYDGYIGESYENAERLVEQKPEKTSSTTKKLGGGGGFADYTLDRLNADRNKESLNLMMSGFVNGTLIYAYEVPHNWKPLMDKLEERTLHCINKGVRVLPNFGYNDYKTCPNIKLIYMVDNLEQYKDYMSKPFYEFVKGLK